MHHFIFNCSYTLILPHCFHHIKNISPLIYVRSLLYYNQLSHQSPYPTFCTGFWSHLLWFTVRQRHMDCTWAWCSHHAFFGLNLVQVFRNWLQGLWDQIVLTSSITLVQCQLSRKTNKAQKPYHSPENKQNKTKNPGNLKA